ncbi:MAG TPA: hypothetical protein DCM08_01470, partial [Microscillaceae bacterium]|nr:hypothetical protein [Microscillaceae bacterium]
CNAGGCVATGQPGNPCPSGNCTSTGWLVPGTLTALPITMASFTAKVVESNKVQLDWVTLIEEDVERFVIVKTRDFKNLFQVGQVTTTGNSNQRKSYQMMDNSAWNGTSYYLVQTIEKDGSVTSSNWISVELNNPQITMTVFPNPATEEIRINLSQNNGADKFIYLFDANGQMVWQEQFRQSDGYVLRRNGLPNGVYILRLVIDMDIITQKIVFN